MRIWIGEEQEGKEKSKKTLFVESVALLEHDLYLIKDIAKKRNTRRIYLGAGKVDVEYLYEDWRTVLSDFDIIMETSYTNYLKPVIPKMFSTCESIIIRMDIPKVSDNISAKIDDTKEVAVFTDKVKTDISTVNKGMYFNDTIIYE